MAAGIQVVDQKTAAGPTFKQAAARWAMTLLPQVLYGLLSVPGLPARTEGSIAAMKGLRPEVERLREQHRGNRGRLNEALMALYEERGVNPWEGCTPLLRRALPGLLCSCILYGPALQGPLHQGLHDRVTKTVVIERQRLAYRRRR